MIETVLANQWPGEWMHAAFVYAAHEETLRRAAVNQEIIGGVKLSTRPDAVLRDIQRAWLGAVAVAGCG